MVRKDVFSSSAARHRLTTAALVLMLLLMAATSSITKQAEEEMSTQDLYIKPFSLIHPSKLTQVEANNGGTYNMTEGAARQIQNYKRGTGLILNIHITHHGGTTVCHALGRSPDAIGTAPSAACNRPRPNDNIKFPNKHPWTHPRTAKNIKLVRENFHMIGWEFGYTGHAPKPSLAVTNWEDPNLLSVIVMRDPTSRLLATSGWIRNHYPDIPRGNATKEDWWEYANHPWFTNNYALRVLAGNGCCNGGKTPQEHLENAKALIERFSIVLDIKCLNEGLEALSSLVNITLAKQKRRRKPAHRRAPSRERVGYDDVYEFLLEKNRLDIELYEWSKSLTLVDCSNL